MKKINSIGYGGKVIGVGIILTAVPVAVKAISHLAKKPILKPTLETR